MALLETSRVRWSVPRYRCHWSFAYALLFSCRPLPAVRSDERRGLQVRFTRLDRKSSAKLSDSMSVASCRGGSTCTWPHHICCPFLSDDRVVIEYNCANVVGVGRHGSMTPFPYTLAGQQIKWQDVPCSLFAVVQSIVPRGLAVYDAVCRGSQ